MFWHFCRRVEIVCVALVFLFESRPSWNYDVNHRTQWNGWRNRIGNLQTHTFTDIVTLTCESLFVPKVVDWRIGWHIRVELDSFSWSVSLLQNVLASVASDIWFEIHHSELQLKTEFNRVKNLFTLSIELITNLALIQPNSSIGEIWAEREFRRPNEDFGEKTLTLSQESVSISDQLIHITLEVEKFTSNRFVWAISLPLTNNFVGIHDFSPFY